MTTDGVVTAISPGVATVTAEIEKYGRVFTTQAEINVVEELEYDIQSTRTATGITIARKPDNIEVGEEYAVQTYILSEMTDDHPYPYGYADDNLVKYSSSNPSVCRVKNGVLLGIAPGTATITASDLTGNVTESFDITVSEPTSLEYTEEQVLEVDAAAYDWSTAETTTLAIQQILSDASAAGMRKVVFPNQIYNVSPAYGTIAIPTQMIVDFSDSVIQIEESAMTSTGYLMFLFQNTEYSSIIRAKIYGERYLISGTGAESCQSIYFSGYNYRSGVDKCTVSNSPGFNVGAIFKRTAMVPFKLSAVEVGGIDENGQDVEMPYAFRCNGYIDISSVGERFGFGNMQGYQGYLYLGARTYRIFFYDAEYNFISYLPFCIQYYQYDKPANARYCRIVFWQASAPTSGDPDFGGIAHLYSLDESYRCYVRDCVMENNYSTAIQPNSGESWVIERCTFRENGVRDPSSHIDWEDGRNHLKGHILRQCTFEGGGTLMAVGADGLVIHNNVLRDMEYKQGGEVQNSRVWLNQFDGAKATVETKTDMVFSQNCGWIGSTFTLTGNDATAFDIRQAGNALE